MHAQAGEEAGSAQGLRAPLARKVMILRLFKHTVLASCIAAMGFASAEERSPSCSDAMSAADRLLLPRSMASEKAGAPFEADRVCFLGRDVTEWAAGPGRTITSAVRSPYGKQEAIVEAAPSREGQTALLVRIFESAQTGALERQVLLESRDDADPKATIERFQIVGFDQVAGAIYFETPAWATSSAVWTVAWPPAVPVGALKPRFVTSGSVIATSIASNIQKWDLLVEQSVIDGARGRVSAFFTYTRDGKQICKVQPDALMRIEPQCFSRR